jgi:N-acetylmuramic acid 6-phosphate etherase
MKAGSSQKMILDMISTSLQIRQGRVEGNKMVNAKLINHKLIDRACRIFMERNPQYTDYEGSEAADSESRKREEGGRLAEE